MRALDQSEIVGKRVTEVLGIEEQLTAGGAYTAFYLVLDTGTTIQLLPFGLRVEQQTPPSAVPHPSEEARFCVGRQITAVITDSREYRPAHEDRSLENPPYDDVYLILDRKMWVANRFFLNPENALSIDGRDELVQLSNDYFDYWTRERVDLKGLLGPGSISWPPTWAL
jgi:hypothetical protein